MIKKDNGVFIADGAKLTGDVTLKQNANIWYNAVLRGDIERIEVGENSNIQDVACIHVDYGMPTIIGNNVTVGHGAIIHGAIIEDDVIIGMGAIVLSGAVVKKGAVVGAGCVVAPKKFVPERTVVVGNPMKVIKEVDDKGYAGILENAKEYVRLAKEQLK